MNVVVNYDPDKHYKILASWWKAHKWPVIEKDHLPETGFIVYDFNNTPIIAGFVYKTDSAFGLFEWIISNPNKHGLIRDIALNQLVSSVIEYSKGVGIKTLFSSITNPTLIRKLSASGFIEADKGMTNMIRRIE